MSKLQQQIDDLTLALEEERLNHKETKKKANQHFNEHFDKIMKEHADYLKNLEEKHKEETENAKRRHQKELTDQKNISEAHMSKMKGEVEFLQGAFDVYKTHLQLEQEERWKAREEDLRMTIQEQTQKQIHDLKTRIIAEKNQEKNELQREHQRETQLAKKEHKRELDALLKKFSNAAADLEKLKETQDKLAQLDEDYKDLQENYHSVCNQMTSLTNTLTDTKVRLIGYEQNFQDKVVEVEDKYRKKIHDLMMQNSELRRLYMKKCGELYDEKTMTDEVRDGSLTSAKETMRTIIATRNRVNINLVAMDAEWDEKPRQQKERPISAPITKDEGHVAILSASETDTKENNTPRPKTSKPHT